MALDGTASESESGGREGGAGTGTLAGVPGSEGEARQAAPAGERALPLSERLERSGRFQLLISILVVLVLLAEICTHLPSSAIEAQLGKPANPIIRIVASEQAWGVFSPNPRSTSLALAARIPYAAGPPDTLPVTAGPPPGPHPHY